MNDTFRTRSKLYRHRIHGFKEAETRLLDDEQVRRLAALSRRARLAAFGRAALAVVAFVPVVAGISYASDHPLAGWSVVLLSVGISLWLLWTVGSSEKLSLLYRRGSRIGRVRRWERQQVPVAVRQAYALEARRERNASSDSDGEEPEDADGDCYWAMDERFERQLYKVAGHQPDSFETVDGDGVLLFVEGRLLNEVVDRRIVEARGS